MSPALIAVVALALGAASGALFGVWLGRRMERRAALDYTERLLSSASDSNLHDIHRAKAYREIEQRLSKYQVTSEGIRKGGVLW